MLVLSRKREERIIIGSATGEPVVLEPGETLEVTVLDIRSSTVRLGIEASSKYRVLRAELQDRVPAERKP